MVDVQCYALVRQFVCAIYTPRCGPGGTPIPPCATLCHEAIRRCGFFFDVFGFTLPRYLDCQLFKDSDNPDECTGMQEVHNLNLEKRNPSNLFLI